MDDTVMALGSTSMAKKGPRGSRGRQRIEIKKLEDESKRLVTFSKRKQGLFKKAKALSTLCGVEVGIITVAKSGRVHTTDNIDAVLENHPSFRHAIDCLQKRKEVEEEGGGGGGGGNANAVEKLEYGVALTELRERAAVRLEELNNSNSNSNSNSIQEYFSSLWSFLDDEDVMEEESVTQLMAEQGIYEWGL